MGIIGNEILFNDSASFFYLENADGGWLYDRYVSVTNLEWPEKVIFVCQYCERVITDISKPCPYCGGPQPIAQGSMGTARATIEAVLPYGLFIFNPPALMEVHYARCGKFGCYENYDFAIELRLLRVMRRQIFDPMTPPIISSTSGPGDAVTLIVEAECEVIFKTVGQ